MATYDALYPLGNGLVKCPQKHCNQYIKPSRYRRHVSQCGQRFPQKTTRANGSTNGRTIGNTFVNAIDNNHNNSGAGSSGDHSSIPTLAANAVNVCEADLWSVVPDGRQSPERLADVNNVWFEGSSDSVYRIKTKVEGIDSVYGSQTNDQSLIESNGQPNEELAEDGAEQWTGGQDFVLFDPDLDYNDMTDDQMTDICNGLVDVLVLISMTKKQRKRLYNRMNEMRREKKKGLIRPAVPFSGRGRPLGSGCADFRPPRAHIKDVFKLKNWNNKAADIAVKHEMVDPFETNWTDDTEVPESAIATDFESMRLIGGCVRPLMQEFICSSCGVYGVFTKSQVNSHLSRHF